MRLLIAYMSMCLIFGTTFLAIKIGNDAGVPPFFAAGVRFCLAGALLFIWCLWRRKTSIKLLLRKEVMIIGSCLTFMTFAGLYYGEQYISSGVAAVLSATGPIMIIGIQTWVLKKKASSALFARLFNGICRRYSYPGSRTDDSGGGNVAGRCLRSAGWRSVLCVRLCIFRSHEVQTERIFVPCSKRRTNAVWRTHAADDLLHHRTA